MPHAGSHVERERLDGEKRLKGDTSDLRTMKGVRFAQSQPLGDLFVNALGLNGDWLHLELAQPRRLYGTIQGGRTPEGTGRHAGSHL